MRPGLPDKISSKPSPDFLPPEKQGFIRNVVDKVATQLLPARERLAPEPLFRGELKTARDKQGFSVVIDAHIAGEERNGSFYIPPQSRAAEELADRIQTFAFSKIPLQQSRGFIANSVDMIDKDRGYWLVLNPDYAAAEGLPSEEDQPERDSVALYFRAMQSWDEKDKELLLTFTDLLTEFSSKTAADHYEAFLGFMTWELESRAQLNRLSWQLDGDGRSSASFESDLGVDGIAEEAKGIWKQVTGLQQELSLLQRAVQNYDHMLKMDELPDDSRQEDSEAIRTFIRNRITQVEQIFQELFLFLPLSKEIFAKGDLSFTNPFAVQADELAGVMMKDVAELRKFCSWVKSSIELLLTMQLFALPEPTNERMQVYEPGFPDTESAIDEAWQEQRGSWQSLEQRLLDLKELAGEYPEVQFDQLADCFTSIFALQLKRSEKQWYSRASTYPIDRLRGSLPLTAQREQSLLTFMSLVCAGTVPTAEQLSILDISHADNLRLELTSSMGKEAPIVKMLEFAPEFYTICEAIVKGGYHDFPPHVKKQISSLVDSCQGEVTDIIQNSRSRSKPKPLEIIGKVIVQLKRSGIMITDYLEETSDPLEEPQEEFLVE